MASLATAWGADTASTHNPRRFTWGAEIGGGIDLTSNDLSTVNLDAFFGYGNSWIDILGVGAGIDMVLNDSYRCFPIYAIFRSSFRKRPSVAFLDLRSGVSINNLAGDTRQSRFYISPAVGFNLARGKSFKSYLTLGYTFNDMQPFSKGEHRVNVHGLHMATLRLGVTF